DLEILHPPFTQITVKADWLPITAISVLALALRWWSPAMQSNLWYDEMVSYSIARLPFTEMIQSMLFGGDANPPLYTFLLHFWFKLGNSDIHIRILSLLFGIGAIPMIYLLARGLWGRVAGQFSSLLLASSLTAITYSVQARAYALLLFLALL